MARFQKLTAMKTRLGAAVVLVVAITGITGAASSVQAVPATGSSAQPSSCDKNLGNLKRAANNVCTQGADTAQAELIWQGRIHLGDEPGIYADAQFSGATAELPITLIRTSAAGEDKTVLVVETQDAQTFQGYPGHAITVILHVTDTATFTAREVVLARARLGPTDNNRKEIPIDLTGRRSPHFISVQVRQDERVPPSAQDDFLLTRLSNLSAGFQFFANYGYNLSPFTD